MPTLRICMTACSLAVCLAAASQTPSQFLVGVVQTSDSKPVAHQNVMIESAALGPYETTDSGKFQFPLSKNLQVGHEATFRIESARDKRWVIIYPCDLRNGRKDSLPAVGEKPVLIMVAAWGSPELKKYYQANCIIEELASQFKPASKERRVGAGLNKGPGAFATEIQPVNFATSKNLPLTSHQFKTVNAVYRDRSGYSEPAASNASGTGNSDLDEFLARKALELGLTVEDLTESIAVWSASAKDPYDKGLAELTEGRYAEASRDISESIASSTGDVLKRYVPLARAEYGQGHYAAAEAALRKVLAVHSDDPLVLNDLGVVLMDRANYFEAEPLLKRALTIDEKVLGPEHPAVALRLNNLAELYREQGKYGEAEPLYKRALAIDEKALGPDHPYVAIVLNNLALCLQARRDYAGAEPLYRRALSIKEKVLGPDHPSVSKGLNNLALLLQDKGDSAAAEPLYRRALAIDEKVLPPDHPDLAADLNNLAELLRRKRDYAGAEPFYRRALAIAEKSLGPDHPSVAIGLNNLALLLEAKGDYAGAEQSYRRALAIAEKALDPNHPTTVSIRRNLEGFMADKQKRDKQ